MKKAWYMLAVIFCIEAAVLAAACGKKTVNPPKSDQETQSGQETGSDQETESAQGQTTAEEEQTESGTESETGQDQLIGGSSGDVLYEIERVEKQYEAEDETPIFEVTLAYPVLEGEDVGSRVINAFYEDWKDKKLNEYETDENSIRQSALEVYRESRDIGWQGPWWEHYEVSSVKTWGGYLSVLTDAYLYEGGAHGMPYREGRVFRLADGQEVALSDLTDKTQEDWEKLLRARFADRVAQGEEGDFYEDAMDLIKERDMSDVGYYFTETGIIFYLSPYEISPYSTGYVEVEIPYEETGVTQFHAD